MRGDTPKGSSVYLSTCEESVSVSAFVLLRFEQKVDAVKSYLLRLLWDNLLSFQVSFLCVCCSREGMGGASQGTAAVLVMG